jgi:hypothetical protein
MAYFVFCSKMEIGMTWLFPYHMSYLPSTNIIPWGFRGDICVLGWYRMWYGKKQNKENVIFTAYWVYWRRVSGASKQVFATIKSKLMPAKLQKQFCYLHYNVFRRKCSLRLRLRHFSDGINCGIDAMKI